MYAAPQTVTLSTTTAGASINYTLDGSTPSETAGTPYAGPVTVSATETIQAIAFASGYTDSTVTTAVFSFPAGAPSFSPAGGNYLTPRTVAIASATSGASISYTTDGSTPSETSGAASLGQ